jgi:2-keto-4-pentenoate hydratase/2-oxohepta-3-ene-1,7-dioic acid hydratase in catechol pathway
MGLHIARFEQDGNTQWAFVKGEALQPIEGQYDSLAEFLARGRSAATDAAAAKGSPVPAGSVRLLSPVTAPCSILCQGLNYGSHRKEAGASSERPPFNLIFMKAPSSLSGPYDDVIRPRGVRLLDYELELGLVIGKPITSRTKITDANLADYVAGIVITNDVSARDVQIPQQQWFKGKSFRTFCPTGPWLYLLEPEDVPRLHDLDIKLQVNGQTRQEANTSQLIFRPAETLTELSGLMDLQPGDLVQTGTPGGVAASPPPAAVQRIARALLSESQMMKVFVKKQLENPKYLKDGDMMKLTMHSRDGAIDLGIMETRVVSENGATG